MAHSPTTGTDADYHAFERVLSAIHTGERVRCHERLDGDGCISSPYTR
ncbi:hypothetical protein [Halalkalicoccus salilacus]